MTDRMVCAVPVLDEGALGLLQRILLRTDGTVTQIVEAYAGEPVGVLKLVHVMSHSRHGGCRELDLGSHEPLLRRVILLRGRYSGVNFLYAEARIAAGRLPSAVVDALAETDLAVGPLLVANRVETWKELLAVGQEPAGECGAHFGLSPEARLLHRTYRVHSNGRPLMVVSEKFPTTAFV